METLNQLLNINPNYIIIGLLVVFFTLEQVTNTPFKFNNRPRHLLQNFLLFVAFFVPNIFFATFQVFCIEWLNSHHIGLLYLIQIPFWLKLSLGVFLYDFTTYWIHRATHKVPFLWRFHRVHHSDTQVDSSSFFRFHPLELMFVFGMGNILCAAIFGTDVLSMVLYYFILNIFSFFEHSNLQYPAWLDKTLGWIFVTPNMHKVHHEQDQHYTDSNFADIFILWDRFFGTYQYKPLKNITLGLTEFDESEKQTFWYLIRSPFLNIKRVPSDGLKTLFILVVAATLQQCSFHKTAFKPKTFYQSDDLVVTQIAENSFQHTSFKQTNDFGYVPCNGLVVRNGNEAVVFDTPTNDKSSEALIQWIEGTLQCKVNAVVPTHFHDDCLGGLQAFHNRNIPSHAYFKTTELARENKYVVPQNSFADSLRLPVGETYVVVTFFGEGHTRDNVVGYFPAENVMFGGCLIKTLDAGKGYLGDANESEWSGTVEKVKKAYPNVKVVVPGHGDYGDKKLLDYTIDLFKTQ